MAMLDRSTLMQDLLDFEEGQLDQERILPLFANLIKSGLAWHLQGHYGRSAMRLIEAGFLSPRGQVLRVMED